MARMIKGPLAQAAFEGNLKSPFCINSGAVTTCHYSLQIHTIQLKLILRGRMVQMCAFILVPLIHADATNFKYLQVPQRL